MKENSRGRPRQYDREVVLADAVTLFSTKGYSATSLDDISEAMNMSRPSIYNAFGDKESIYLAAMQSFIDRLRSVVHQYEESGHTLGKALEGIYYGALDVYFSHKPAMGCFIFCTAPAEVLTHPEVKKTVQETLKEIDELFTGLFRSAQSTDKNLNDLDPVNAGKLAQAVLHTLAIRARSGDSKASLKRLADYSITTLCVNN